MWSTYARLMHESKVQRSREALVEALVPYTWEEEPCTPTPIEWAAARAAIALAKGK